MTATSEIEAPSAPSALSRYKEITLFLLKYGGWELVERLGAGRFLPGGRSDNAGAAKATELTDDLERLGPTFVKLGQILSSRADILPEEFLEPLARLQDRLEPIPWEKVQATVEAELGTDLDRLFDRFDPVPVGSASLGQVHTALLKSGRSVAVKVQRPGIKDVIRSDMKVLREFAEWFDAKTDVGQRYRFREILRQFERTLWEELDYEIEAQNLVRLRSNLSEFREIIVPQPVPDYCTPAVLTMDYVEGRKVTKLGPLGLLELDGDHLADRLFQAYLKQVFVDGFFHADPHPGNVFIVDNRHLALLDLGLVGRFTPFLRKKLLQLLPAINRGDAQEVADIAFEIGDVSAEADRAGLEQAFAGILRDNVSVSLDQLRVSRVLMGILRACGQADVHLPPEINMFGRTLLHLERVGRVLSPGFNANEAINRHIDGILRRQMVREASPRRIFSMLLDAKDLVEQLPRRLNRLLDATLDKKLEIRVDVVPENLLLESLQKIANRITTGLIVASLIIGASQLMQVETAFTLWGYPGLAMICFTVALVGAVALVLAAIRGDHATRQQAPGKKRPGA